MSSIRTRRPARSTAPSVTCPSDGTERPMTRHRVLDGLVLAAGTLLVAAGLVVNFVLWPPVERLLASSPADFAAAFGRMTGIARGVFTGLGLLTSVLILISLVREGGIGARRGRLRLLAIVALVAAGLVGALAIDPVQGAILAAAHTATASLPALLESWSRWGRVNLGMGVVALIALVLAHRAPVVASGGTSVLSPGNRKLLLLLSTATLFEGYDRFIATLALPYIAKDLGAGEGVLGWTLVTALTGLSRGLPDFVALQVIATVFLTTELALAQVVIAEEFPATA